MPRLVFCNGLSIDIWCGIAWLIYTEYQSLALQNADSVANLEAFIKSVIGISKQGVTIGYKCSIKPFDSKGNLKLFRLFAV